MPFASSHGTGIYYERHGPKPGPVPAIVFVHGAGGNHLSWWQQVPAFCDRYSCITFAHRGQLMPDSVIGGTAAASAATMMTAMIRM